MATLYVKEFANLRSSPSTGIEHVSPSAGTTTQTVTVGVASAASSAFAATTNFVEVVADVACYIQFGTSPTATATTGYLPADTFVVWRVPQGEAYKVAVLQI